MFPLAPKSIPPALTIRQNPKKVPAIPGIPGALHAVATIQSRSRFTASDFATFVVIKSRTDGPPLCIESGV
jgi:hypothetical protein